MTLTAAALLCLSLNSYHEARGEPFQGQVAVAQVVLRRAGFDQRKVCRVVYSPAQFSWTRDRPKVRNRAAWQEAQKAARVALLWMMANHIPDYSRGADHYHATWIKQPRWARGMEKVATIGEHEFYVGNTELLAERKF